MNSTNNVFQVLVTKGNSPVLPQNQTLDDLVVGQIGVFNAETNQSIDGSKAVKDFYLAVGNAEGAGTVKEEISFSAGRNIPTLGISEYNFRGHTAERPQIFQIKDYKNVQCNAEYFIRLEFRNSVIYRTQGPNQFTKAFTVKTSTYANCGASGAEGAQELTKLFLTEMQANAQGLFKVEAIDAAGAVIQGDFNTWAAANPTVSPGLQITALSLKDSKFNEVPNLHYYPRLNVIIPALGDTLAAIAKIEYVQDGAAEEGSGTDVRFKEYIAGGWNSRPKRYRIIDGVGNAQGYKYYSDPGVKYDLINLQYVKKDPGSTFDFINTLNTLVAIPEADTATRDSLLGVLDKIAITQGFDALADDAALASTNPATVEPTPTSYDTDTLA